MALHSKSGAVQCGTRPRRPSRTHGQEGAVQERTRHGQPWKVTSVGSMAPSAPGTQSGLYCGESGTQSPLPGSPGYPGYPNGRPRRKDGGRAARWRRCPPRVSERSQCCRTPRFVARPTRSRWPPRSAYLERRRAFPGRPQRHGHGLQPAAHVPPGRHALTPPSPRADWLPGPRSLRSLAEGMGHRAGAVGALGAWRRRRAPSWGREAAALCGAVRRSVLSFRWRCVVPSSSVGVEPAGCAGVVFLRTHTAVWSASSRRALRSRIRARSAAPLPSLLILGFL